MRASSLPGPDNEQRYTFVARTAAGSIWAAPSALPGLSCRCQDRHSDDQVVSKDGYSVRPPSTKIVWPVMYADSSEQRNAATAAISSASPARRIGIWLSTIRRLTGSSIQDRLIGVTVAPGPMLLTRIPRAAYSRASDRVRFCMPPYDTE